MDRLIADRSILDKICEEFCAILERHCKYIVVSGFIAIASGRTRGTEDIDIIIERLPLPALRQLVEDLDKHSFTCMQSDRSEEVYDYLKNNTPVRFTRKDKPLPEMEVKFAKDLLDLEQLNQRAKLPLTGLDIWFCDVNMTIAFKEELLKSPKDMEDARHLRIVFRDIVSEDAVRSAKKQINKYRP